MASRPCDWLESAAATTAPSGEPVLRLRSSTASSFPSPCRRCTCDTKSGGMMREARSAQSRSAMMAMATMEQAMMGAIIQPPSLMISSTFGGSR